MLCPTSATRDAPVAREDRVDLRGDLVDEALDRFERRAVAHRVDRADVARREVLRAARASPRHCTARRGAAAPAPGRARAPDPPFRSDRAPCWGRNGRSRASRPRKSRALAASPIRISGGRSARNTSASVNHSDVNAKSTARYRSGAPDDVGPRTRAGRHGRGGPCGVQRDGAADDEPERDRGGHGAGSYLPPGRRAACRDARGAWITTRGRLAFRYGGRARVRRPPPRARRDHQGERALRRHLGRAAPATACCAVCGQVP